MDPQLTAIIDDLEAAGYRLRLLRGSVPSPALGLRPSPGQWSAAECLSHLNLTSEAVLPMLRGGLSEARDGQPRTAPYRRDAIGWMLWMAMSPSSRLKTKTIPAFAPSGDDPFDPLHAYFDRLQAEIIQCVRMADGLPIDRVKLVSPFDSRLKYNLYAVLTLVPRHQHRHLLQAERAARAASVQPVAHALAAANSMPNAAMPQARRGSNRV